MIAGIPRGLRLMAAGALAFSAMSAFAKLAGQTVPLFALVCGRSVVVALLSGGALYRQRLSLRAREPGLLVLRGLTGFAALSCYFYSVLNLPLADATVLYFTNPVLTALAAAALLGERMGAREVGLVLVSLSGVLIVARPEFLVGSGRSLDPFAVSMGVAAAALGAGSYVTIRMMKHDPPLLVVFYFSVITVLLSAPLALLEPVTPTLRDALLVVACGVATHLGQLFVTWGFRLERAGRASAVGYLQIAFAAVWGWALFTEIPDVWTWLGAAVIVGSTWRLVRTHPVR